LSDVHSLRDPVDAVGRDDGVSRLERDSGLAAPMLLGIKQRAERLTSTGGERTNRPEAHAQHPDTTKRSSLPERRARTLSESQKVRLCWSNAGKMRAAR